MKDNIVLSFRANSDFAAETERAARAMNLERSAYIRKAIVEANQRYIAWQFDRTLQRLSASETRESASLDHLASEPLNG